VTVLVFISNRFDGQT